MAATIIPTRFQLRRHPAAWWQSTNPVPLAGEPCLETDTGLRKLGDGVTAWNALLYQLSGPAYDLANLADGDTPIWDAANKRWKHGPGGKVYQSGTGIAIDNPSAATPTIRSTLGSIHIDSTVATYSALPSPPPAGMTTYLVQADRLIYVWGAVGGWPAEGKGLSSGGGGGRAWWRLSVTATAGGATGVEIQNMELRIVGGSAILATVAYAFGSTPLVYQTITYSPRLAFNGSTNADNQLYISAAAASAASPIYLGYCSSFGIAPTQLMLQARTNYNVGNPTSFKLQSSIDSTDGIDGTWIDALTVAGATWSGAYGEMKTWAI
jgi:hypothetical protein